MSRDLTTYLNPQINHLVSSRPMAVSMENAIRYLEVEISVLELSLPEQDAKELLCERVDHYVCDNITVADKIIQEVAAEKIHDGDVVLAYARCSSMDTLMANNFPSLSSIPDDY
ncbi:hypothetical protein M422DRAFT_68846 [Sphaerobolus stellatus SS14]|uniref:Translation initiation factor eIF2B subunit delta n=1 Tax=Sphaerobolus stellatus (strain SS14) TaxID=990650 RepID=A0A0C9VMR4_SPHS4|nr:hypothetical protein M422DRAFT_68846 [Sphaerobolus stellatus SS14]